jgi:hypothetical protein
MNTLSKTLDVADYKELYDSTGILTDLERTLSQHGVVYRNEHQHRKWEYSMTLKALKMAGAKSLLDVGGGGSIFAPFARMNGLGYVLQVDPGDVGSWIQQQAHVINYDLDFVQKDFLNWDDERQFEAVSCLSVIEHVPSHIEFFTRLLERVVDRGLLCLTTDFHPSGEAKVGGHLRTYNANSMKTFVEIAFMYGFTPFLGEPDYSKFEVAVNSYTFASLILRKDYNGYTWDTHPEPIRLAGESDRIG